MTLIELLIALTIAAILAAVAYPSYLSQVAKGRRADGKQVGDACSTLGYTQLGDRSVVSAATLTVDPCW